METTTLGKNGPAVTTLGIGAWSWGDRLFWDYGRSFGLEDVEKAFYAAIDAGITFFDTAEIYGLGESEKLIGRFLKNTPVKVDIATKYAPYPLRLGGDAVHQAVTDSLHRLQLERITLYQVHWPFTFLMSQQTLMDALADEVQRGRIETVGVSNYSAQQMRQAYEILQKRDIPLAVNQIEYSLLHRQVETQGIISTARELGVTILAYSPLAQGLLTGKYTPQKHPEGARKLDSRFSGKGLEKIAPVLDCLRQLGDKYQKTPAQVALNWLIAQDDVIPIPGAKNAQQAIQNAGALGWQLKAEDVRQLEKVSRPWL
jgi:aryl-alcohol dehydrogenase-like predicted oxidoreductase